VTPETERAINDALTHGKALLKFISANDTGLTGSHQAGFYLPKGGWELFTPYPPEKGRLDKSPVRITWQDGLVTDSVVTWYGRGTRSEYRLTRFGRGFPWLVHDLVGALLVLIPVSHQEFLAYILDRDEEIEEVQAALDSWVLESWTVFIAGREVEETADVCLSRLSRAFALAVEKFPATKAISEKAREIVYACMAGITGRPSDEQLLEFVRNELQLFKMIERKFYQGEVTRLFADIEDFVQTALRILNARKSRAGRALENHIEFLFRGAGLPFEMRAIVEGTRPDVLMPGRKAYEDATRGKYPVEKLIMMGVKTTCKDRWRQVVSEAPQIQIKHILTMQEGVSPKQLDEMHRNHVVLVVPEPLHHTYPKHHPIKLLGVDAFIDSARKILA
jgi:type II restriction enzyme